MEEALNEEAKILRLADGGVLLESLRTRRLLETAELALKVRIVNTLESRFVIMISSVIRVEQRESKARKEIEAKLSKSESRAQRAEGEKSDRIKAEEALLVLPDLIIFITRPAESIQSLRLAARWQNEIIRPCLNMLRRCQALLQGKLRPPRCS